MIKILLIWSVLFCLTQISCNSGKAIQGQIVDTENNPIEGATIKLLVWDQKKDAVPTKTIDTVKSGRNGEFGFNIEGEAPETKLVMDIEKDGFKLTIAKFTPLLIQKNGDVFKNYKVILEKK